MGDRCRVKIDTQREGAAAVRQRLRTLLELAIAIGRRQGLLGDQSATKREITETKRDPELYGKEAAVD